MTTRKAFVLLSGGLDSSTVLALAANDPSFDEIQGVSINYGQRHSKEATFAAHQCGWRRVQHVVIDVGPLLRGGMLTDKTQEIPDIKYDQIRGVSPTYVPFRNGTFLSVVTAHAQRWINEGERRVPRYATEAVVMFGAHADDAHNWAYPDCTPEFVGAMANAIFIGTYQKVRLSAPLLSMQKHEIVTLGTKLGVNFVETWSCYAGGDMHCGKCPTCYSRQDAFVKAGVVDPTMYATPRRDSVPHEHHK